MWVGLLNNSRLLVRIFGATVAILSFSFLGIYFLSVPYIDETVRRHEADAARAILNVAYETVAQSSRNLADFRQAKLAEKQARLWSRLKTLELRAQLLDKQVLQGRFSRGQALRLLLEEIESMRPAEDDYIFAIGHGDTAAAHPDHAIPGLNPATAHDANTRQIIQGVLDTARGSGQGCFPYRWPRPGDSQPVENLACVMDLAPFNISIAAVLTSEGIDLTAQEYAKNTIDSLRKSLNEIRIARTGYIFIYDPTGLVIVHPNPTLEGKSIASITERRSGKSILEVLTEKSDSVEPARYVWDSPADPGHFVYEKVAWIRHHKALDWRIGASVYEEELGEVAATLHRRILIVLSSMLVVSLGMVFFLHRKMSIPLKRLSDSAAQVSAGNLSARCEVAHPDEIGMVAEAFNAMLDTLQRNERELRLAQTQILQSEKLASVGQLAAGVAHEINNPIGFVQSNLGALKTQVEQLLAVIESYRQAEPALAGHVDLMAKIEQAKSAADLEYVREDVLSVIKESLDGVARVKRIVEDLRDFSRVDSAEWHQTNLERGLESTLSIAWNEIRPKADVIKEFGGLPEIECIGSQINQVFLCLLMNAAQAIETRGTITLRTGFDAEHVWVEVTDTGCGIPPENLSRIFDPFFTTKPVGKGAGLGLSLAYGIVKTHHGRIEADSKVGVGTTFRVRLPIRQPGSQASR